MNSLSTAPIVTIKTARRLLGKDADTLTDAEIITLVDKLEQIAGAFISEKVLNMQNY
jgi:hypothetical protein